MSNILLPKPALGTPIAKGQLLSKDLVANFPFSDARGDILSDFSLEKNHGTITGATWVGNGLSFDGTSDHNIALTDTPFEGITAFTVIVTATPIDISVDRGLFYTDRHAGGEPLLFWMDTAATNFLAALLNTSSGTTGALLGSTPLLGGVKYMVALAWDGSTVRAYVNGIEQGGDFPATIDGTLDVSTGGVYYIGNDITLSKDFYGVIENTYLYSRALSASEIAALYINPALPMQQPAIWLFTPPVVSAGMAGIYYRTLMQGVA